MAHLALHRGGNGSIRPRRTAGGSTDQFLVAADTEQSALIQIKDGCGQLPPPLKAH